MRTRKIWPTRTTGIWDMNQPQPTLSKSQPKTWPDHPQSCPTSNWPNKLAPTWLEILTQLTRPNKNVVTCLFKKRMRSLGTRMTRTEWRETQKHQTHMTQIGHIGLNPNSSDINLHLIGSLPPIKKLFLYILHTKRKGWDKVSPFIFIFWLFVSLICNSFWFNSCQELIPSLRQHENLKDHIFLIACQYCYRKDCLIWWFEM